MVSRTVRAKKSIEIVCKPKILDAQKLYELVRNIKINLKTQLVILGVNFDSSNDSWCRCVCLLWIQLGKYILMPSVDKIQKVLIWSHVQHISNVVVINRWWISSIEVRSKNGSVHLIRICEKTVPALSNVPKSLMICEENSACSTNSVTMCC